MARVLITGLHGFTGRYAQAELRRAGWEVFGMGVGEAPDDVGYRSVSLGDAHAVRDWIECIQPHAVLHLAGVANVGHGSPNDFYEVNLIGTRNLLGALAESGSPLSCVVLASSANVYGNSREGMLDECVPPEPANDYAVSKLAMEHMARLWGAKLPIVIVRPFNYTGVGQSESFLLPKIVSHFKRRAEVIELGNIDVWRDFSDVRSLVEVYRRLLEAGPAGQTVNFCSGRTWSLREVIGMVQDLSGHSLEIRVNPALVRANEVRKLWGDPSRLEALIGPWSRPSLEQTLRWMLES